MGRFKKKYFYVSRNKKKPLARKYEINKTCYLLMLLYNFCKYYNYSFNSLAIFCGNRIELLHLCSLISDIDCKPSFSLFDGTRGGDVDQFSGLTICANICYGTIFFQLMTNHHIILILQYQFYFYHNLISVCPFNLCNLD